MATLFIRADASASIGTGHLARMSVLARALQAKGVKSVLLCRPLDGLAPGLAARSGLEVRLLESAGPRPSAAGDPGARLPADEARQVAELARRADAGVFVDHYGADEDYLQIVRPAARFLACADDTAGRDYPADLVLNHNVGAETLRIRALPAARLLVGPAYAVVREQFRRLHDRERPTGGPARVLVLFGGSDPRRQTERFARILETETRPDDCEIHAVVGRAAKDEAAARLGGEGIRVHADVADMAALMSRMDFAFSAGGTTHLELACLGVPAALVVVAANQQRLVEQCARHEIALDLGWFDRLDDDTIRQAFRRLAGDAGLRTRMSRNGRRLVDGRGADRVASEVVALFAEPRRPE